MDMTEILNVEHSHPKISGAKVIGRLVTHGEILEKGDVCDGLTGWVPIPWYCVGIIAQVGPNAAIIVRPAKFS
jgi:hypothetical protein